MKCESHGLGITAGEVLGREAFKPNPSPQEIYRHIAQHKLPEENWECKNASEKRAFDEFMKICPFYSYQLWVNPLEDAQIRWIKSDHPTWYSWLVQKGLVERRTVKRTFIADVRWEKHPDFVYPITIKHSWQWNKLVGIKGKLTFEYEEEEPEGEGK